MIYQYKKPAKQMERFNRSCMAHCEDFTRIKE